MRDLGISFIPFAVILGIWCLRIANKQIELVTGLSAESFPVSQAAMVAGVQLMCWVLIIAISLLVVLYTPLSLPLTMGILGLIWLGSIVLSTLLLSARYSDQIIVWAEFQCNQIADAASRWPRLICDNVPPDALVNIHEGNRVIVATAEKSGCLPGENYIFQDLGECKQERRSSWTMTTGLGFPP